MSSAGTSVVLLSVKERIKNLSAHQIAKTLDDFIFAALKPILQTSHLVNLAYCEVLYFYALGNKKRKITAHEHRADFMDLLFTFLMADDIDVKAAALRSFKIERQINFRIINVYRNGFKNWPTLYSALLNPSLPRLERATHLVLERQLRQATVSKEDASRYDLFVAQKSVQQFSDLAYTFRRWVVEKYIRWAHKKAMSFIRQTALHIDPDDLLENLFVAIMTAIDKYHSDKGALTSYIEYWVKNGATQAAGGHEYGVAYQIPPAQRRKMIEAGVLLDNFVHDLETAADICDATPTGEKNLEDQERAEYLYTLLRGYCLHPYSLALLEVPMTFTPQHLQRFAATRPTQ